MRFLLSTHCNSILIVLQCASIWSILLFSFSSNSKRKREKKRNNQKQIIAQVVNFIIHFVAVLTELN